MLSNISYIQPLHSEAQRLFHGRGHAYPGLEHVSIDWLSPVILITLFKEEEQASLVVLAKRLYDDIDECNSVQVQYRYLQQAPCEVLIGSDLSETVVVENSLKYKISLGKAQNTGLFLDMKNGRSWVKMHSHQKKVLNLFAYTCAFSVSALAGGARGVVNIDMSRPSLTTGRENHRLNQQDTGKVVFEGVDIFKSFGRIKKHGPYDLLVCDPPSFQKGSVDIKRDYKKIIRRIPELMNPGSELMLCLNSPDLDDEFLKQTVSTECPECQYIESIQTPDVFQEAMVGKGLKVHIYKYNP